MSTFFSPEEFLSVRDLLRTPADLLRGLALVRPVARPQLATAPRRRHDAYLRAAYALHCRTEAAKAGRPVMPDCRGCGLDTVSCCDGCLESLCVECCHIAGDHCRTCAPAVWDALPP